MKLDDYDVDDFLAAYCDECARAGVAPLPVAELVALVEIILGGAIAKVYVLN